MKLLPAIIFIPFLVFTCGGQAGKTPPKVIGGCVIDTIKINLDQQFSDSPVKSYSYIDVMSLEFKGVKLSRQICVELKALIDSLDIATLGRSDIMRVTKGPCWPPYRISFHIETVNVEGLKRLEELLLSAELAGYTPAAERPDRYGAFFITCRRADKDLWTVWYTGTQ